MEITFFTLPQDCSQILFVLPDPAIILESPLSLCFVANETEK